MILAAAVAANSSEALTNTLHHSIPGVKFSATWGDKKVWALFFLTYLEKSTEVLPREGEASRRQEGSAETPVD